MKTSELSIGNYVDLFGYSVIIRLSKDTVTVENLDSGEIHEVKYNHISLDSIWVTPWVLEACGFDKRIDKDGKDSYVYESIGVRYTVKFMDDGFPYPLTYIDNINEEQISSPVPVPYLHNLQNVITATLGGELKFDRNYEG
jgi:hypothetical protein